MKISRQTLGRWGELQAEHYLSSQGYTILARNYRTPHGEIDLIARLGNLTVFVEVKTRRTRTFGFPEESVNRRKQEHLRNSVEYYMQQNPELEGEWQIDVISIELYQPQQAPLITHFQNAVS